MTYLKYSTIRTYSSDLILAKSWENFNERACNRWNAIMAAYTEALNAISEVTVNSAESLSEYCARCRAAATEAANTALVGCYIDSAEFRSGQSQLSAPQVSAMMNQINLHVDTHCTLKEGIDALTDAYSAEAWKEATIPNYFGESADQMVMYVNGTAHNVGDFLSNMNSSLHAAVCELGVARILTLPDISNAADKIQLLRDTVMDTFRNGYADISGYLKSKISLVKNKFFNIKSAITAALDYSGLSAVADDLGTIRNSRSYTYTGASPASAYAAEIAGSVAKAGWTAFKAGVKAFIAGVANVVLKAGKWVANKVIDTFINPYDIVNIPGGETLTVDQFYNYASFKPWRAPADILIDQRATPFVYYYKIVRDLAMGQTIHFDTVVCEGIIGDNSDRKPLTQDQAYALFPIHSGMYQDTFDGEQPATLLEMWRQYAWMRRPQLSFDDIMGASLMQLMELSLRGTNQSYFETFKEAIEYAIGETIPDSEWGIDPSDPYTWNQSLEAYSRRAFAAFNPISDHTGYAVKYKFKPANYRMVPLFMSMCQPTHVSGYKYTVKAGDLRNFLNGAIASEEFLVDADYKWDNDPTTDLGEVYLHNSFVFASAIQTALSEMCRKESLGISIGDNDDVEMFLYKLNPINNPAFDSTEIQPDGTGASYPIFISAADTNGASNEDFVCASTGYLVQIGRFGDDLDFTSWYNHVDGLVKAINNYGMYNDYAEEEYVPVLYNSDFFSPSMRIKTDYDNALAWVTAISALGFATVIAVVAVVAAIILKKAVRKSYISTEAAKYALEDKIKAGTVTKQDWKQYFKVARKDRLINKIAGNLTNSSSDEPDTSTSSFSLGELFTGSAASTSELLANIDTKMGSVDQKASENLEKTNTVLQSIEYVPSMFGEVERLITGA